MFAWFGDLSRFLVQSLTSETRPRSLALGMATGVAIGLMPKANLLAVALVCLLFVLRTNILAGLLTALICSWISFIVDPVLHHFGHSVLAITPLQGLFASLYQLPYVPWTAFNNTVVMGALFIGALQFYPTYRIALRYFEKRSSAYQDWRVRPHGDTTRETLPSAWRIG